MVGARLPESSALPPLCGTTSSLLLDVSLEDRDVSQLFPNLPIELKAESIRLCMFLRKFERAASQAQSRSRQKEVAQALRAERLKRTHGEVASIEWSDLTTRSWGDIVARSSASKGRLQADGWLRVGIPPGPACP